MALVNSDSIYYFRPPSTARPVMGRSAVGKHGPSTASSEHNDPVALAPKTTASADLKDFQLIECFELIECVDLTALPVEAVDPLGVSALGFEGSEALQAPGKINCP